MAARQAWRPNEQVADREEALRNYYEPNAEPFLFELFIDNYLFACAQSVDWH